MNNYTSYANLQLIKNNLIDVYADYLRYADKKYAKHEDKVDALEKFIIAVRPIKNLAVLQDMRKRYEIKNEKS